MKHEIKAMRRTGGGAIVNNSSMNGVAIAHATEYTASKHAVIGATRGAASEARETGVRVNAVLPGLIVTPERAGARPDRRQALVAVAPRRRRSTSRLALACASAPRPICNAPTSAPRRSTATVSSLRSPLSTARRVKRPTAP